jgi:hypothetical protein
MRIVEISPLHVANATAGMVPPFHSGVKPPNKFVHSAPYQRLEEVVLTKAAGTQILVQARLQGPLLPAFSGFERDSDCIAFKARLWLRLLMRGLYLTFHSPSASRRPISNVTLELPDRKPMTDIRLREHILYDSYHGIYEDSTAECIELSFFRNTSELTECSQTLRLSNMHGGETRDMYALPRRWAGSELITTYRPSEPNVAYALSVQMQLTSVVPHIVWWIRWEIEGRCSRRPPMKAVIHVPVSSNATPHLETLSSLVESGYLTSPAEDRSKSRMCAAEMYRIVQYLVDSHDHPKLDCGKKSLVSRTCERIHLDLAGMDKEDLDVPTTERAKYQWSRHRERLKANLNTPRSSPCLRWSMYSYWDD